MSVPWRPEGHEFDKILHRLQAQAGVRRALLVAPDGLLIAGAAPGEEEAELWGAVSAVLGNLGGQLTAGAQGGGLRSAVFYTAEYRFVIHRLNLGFALAVAPPEADLDELCAKVERTAQELEACAARFVTGAREGNDRV